MNPSCSRVPQSTRRSRKGAFQKRATSARSSSICTRLMRACGGISKARNSSRPRRPVALPGRVELVDRELGAVRVAREVDEEVAQDPVDEPGLLVRLPGRQRRLELLEGDRQLVERVVAGLVHARALARGADEETREQVGERRVDLPVADQGAQQVRAAQQRAVRGGRPPDGHVVAAAGAGVAAVEHEFLGAQPREARLLVEERHVVGELVPVRGRVDVHLDHARVRGDREAGDARIVGRRVALEAHRAGERARGRLDRPHEAHEVLRE